MKKLYFLLSLAVTFTAGAQIVPIPDSVLKSRLLSTSVNGYYTAVSNGELTYIDTNYNGQIEVSEAQAIQYLNIRDVSGIGSFQGLEAFSNLIDLKFSGYNMSGTINVSGFPVLQKLTAESLFVNSFSFSDLPSLTEFHSSNNAIINFGAPQGLPQLTKMTIANGSSSSAVTYNTAGCTNLKDLSAYGMAVWTMNMSHFPNLEKLYLGSGGAPTLMMNQHPLLKEFTLKSDNVTVLDLSSNTLLEKLDCSDALHVSALNVSGCVNLKTLSCSVNELTTLDLSSLIMLEYLNASTNSLTSVTFGSHPVLLEVYLNSNQLTTINLVGMPMLEKLIMDANNLSSIDLGSNVLLKNLDVSENALSALNVSNLTALEVLNCNYNILSTLSVAGLENLQEMSAHLNQLTSVDFSGCISLFNVNVVSNQLTTVDFTDCISLSNYAIGDNNNLESIFVKNGALSYIPYMYFPNLKYICADEDRVQAYKNALLLYGYDAEDVEVNSYCTFTPGGVSFTINGNAALDSNTNGCEPTDIMVPGLKLSITDDIQSGSVTSGASGNYSIEVGTGTYTLTPTLENPSYFNVSPSSVSVTFPTQTSPQTNNFCLTANGIHPDAEILIIPLIAAVPGFDVTYKIVYKNKGNVTLNNGVVGMTYDDTVLDFVSANGTGQYFEPNIVGWSYTNLQPFETREILVAFNLNSPMETPAVNSGYQLIATAFISTENDETPQDNDMQLEQIVVNAMDPNEKICLEGHSIVPEMVGEYVHYLIRFENLGTAPAQNIVVKDMIDVAKLDISTLVPLDSSHPFTTRITNTNKVEFIFKGINLPFDNANNDGYVSFKIRTTALVLGNTFSNSASIYFDYNFPVITDPAVTTVPVLGTDEFVNDTIFAMYPNPVQNVLHIDPKNASQLKSVGIYNVLGQLVVAVTHPSIEQGIDLSSLAVGNYVVKIISDKGVYAAKLIKK